MTSSNNGGVGYLIAAVLTAVPNILGGVCASRVAVLKLVSGILNRLAFTGSSDALRGVTGSSLLTSLA